MLMNASAPTLRALALISNDQIDLAVEYLEQSQDLVD